jgi:uncharacterized membrane protein YbhN (UPF0104 family)
MRRLPSFLLKAAVSVLLLYLSLQRVDLNSVGQRLSAIDLHWVIFVVAGLMIQTLLGALRWREIVAICGAKLSAVVTLRYTFIGQFFSQVLPSTVGGDAVRIWLLARSGAGWPAAIYSVLIDRVVGVAVLAIIVIACLPWTLNLIQDPVARWALATIGFGALGATLIFLALGHRHLRVLERWWLTRHLTAASRLAWRLCQSATGARIAPLSFTIHFMSVAVMWGAAKATHATVDIVQVLFLVLPVILIATIPVSIAGWGVRESAMILAFGYAGLAETDGLIVSILYGLVGLGVGAIGGLVWVASGDDWRSVKSMENDTQAHDASA